MNFPSLINQIVGLDTETTGLRPYLGDVAFGVSVAIGGFSGYWDVRKTPQVFDWLREELPRARVIVGHHMKFDCHMLAKEGIEYMDVPWHDTMIVDTLCYEHHMKYDLDSVAMRRLKRGKRGDLVEEWMHISGAKSRNAAMATLKDAPFELIAPYAIQDAELLLPVYTDQMREIAEQQLENVYALEMDLLPVLFDMEMGGVKVDVVAAEKSIPELTEIVDMEQKKLNDLVGFDMNVNSTPQVRKVFQPEKIGKWQYKLIDGTICWTTKTGAPSIDQNVLKEMTHPAAGLIRKVRKVKKLRDTFVKGHILGNVDEYGYVHTTFNSTRNDADAGTVTGRLSSTDPALQQVNKRDKDTAKILRSMFLPDTGTDWLGMDFGSADFHIAAHYLRDPAMTEAYNNDPDTDFHQFVADMIGIPRSPRFAGDPNAKTLNLAMAFGAGAGKTAVQLGMPYTIGEWENGRMKLIAGPEAQAVLNTYHTKFPAFKAFSRNAQAVAKDRGYVMSVMGRRLRFVSNDEHKAAGYLFQSGCAECMKTKMVQVWKMLRRTGYRMHITVHDELGISAPKDGKLDDEIKRVYTDFQSEEAPFKLRVPMTASFKRGVNWWEA